MNFLKSLKINTLITSILYIALGVLFILLPDEVTYYLAYIAGGVLAITGIAYIISYFRKWDIEYRSNGLAIGILLLFAALFLIVQSELIVAAIPVLLGLAVVISGTIKLQNAIVLNKEHDGLWRSVLVMAIVCLAMGVVFMLNPFATTHVLVIIIGVSLILSGLSDLVIIFLMSRRAKASARAARAARGGAAEGAAKEPTDAV